LEIEITKSVFIGAPNKKVYAVILVCVGYIELNFDIFLRINPTVGGYSLVEVVYFVVVAAKKETYKKANQRKLTNFMMGIKPILRVVHGVKLRLQI
jgi:hypothetical protein